MYICAEKYFNLTQDEYLEIKKFIDNNIYTVEATLAPMHEVFDFFKKCYDQYCYCPCNCHCKQNNRKCNYLTDKYIKFCKEVSIIFKKTTKSYYNAEYVKYFYLLQKAADKVTSKKLNLYNEKIYTRKINTFINMFIKVYYRSNIDCNRKVENKIYALYEQYSY